MAGYKFSYDYQFHLLNQECMNLQKRFHMVTLKMFELRKTHKVSDTQKIKFRISKL